MSCPSSQPALTKLIQLVQKWVNVSTITSEQCTLSTALTDLTKKNNEITPFKVLEKQPNNPFQSYPLFKFIHPCG